MSYSKQDDTLIKTFFSCRPEEEDDVINLMPAGRLQIKLTKFQRQQWESNYLAAIKEAEGKKPVKPDYKKHTTLILAIAICGLALMVAGAGFWPLLVVGAILLSIVPIFIAVKFSISLWNFTRGATSKRHYLACENLKNSQPDYILEQKLKKLIECGKFSCLDFSTPAQEENDKNNLVSCDNSLPKTVLNSTLELIDKINSPLLLKTFERPKITIRYTGKDYIEQRNLLDKELVTNNHYQRGLTFFTTFTKMDLPFDLIYLITQTWSNLSGFNLENSTSIKLLIALKLNDINPTKNINNTMLNEPKSIENEDAAKIRPSI
ncbi:MAG: hypothetical protein H0U57_05665 [Tatlockia sp.]|nr:hypothetical protein [Tatlockia sp.]